MESRWHGHCVLWSGQYQAGTSEYASDLASVGLQEDVNKSRQGSQRCGDERTGGISGCAAWFFRLILFKVLFV